MCGVNHPVAALIQFPHCWPFRLADLPTTAYLVGGAVRDVLLNRQTEHLDLDFVLPQDAVSVASDLARRYEAGFVLLDAERQIARVVFPQATVDFAQQVGTTLETDLQRRDFTANAIAYNPHECKLYDPLGGYQDLQNRQLKMVSAVNLEEDPLRLLRAYRQAAQLNFSLETTTQTQIRQLAPHLKRVAAERVQTELRYLLSAHQGQAWVTAAWDDHLLQDWLQYTDAERIAHFQAIDQAEQDWIDHVPEFTDALQIRVNDSTFAPKTCQPQICTLELHRDRNLRLIARLASLVSLDPELAEQTLQQLKFSRAEVRAVSILLRCLPRLQTSHLPLSPRQQYFLFQEVGALFPAFVIFAVGAGISQATLLPMVQRFLDPCDVVAHPQNLISGKDLIRTLNLAPGPQIGKLLAEIQLAQAEGKVATPEQALAFAQQQVMGCNMLD